MLPLKLLLLLLVQMSLPLATIAGVAAVCTAGVATIGAVATAAIVRAAI